jgi:hypothetical protein
MNVSLTITYRRAVSRHVTGVRHENPIVGSVRHTRDTTPRNAHQNALISKAIIINFLTN